MDLSIWRQFDRTNGNALQPFTGVTTSYPDPAMPPDCAEDLEVTISSYVRWPTAVRPLVRPVAGARYMPDRHRITCATLRLDITGEPLVAAPAHGALVQAGEVEVAHDFHRVFEPFDHLGELEQEGRRLALEAPVAPREDVGDQAAPRLDLVVDAVQLAVEQGVVIPQLEEVRGGELQEVRDVLHPGGLHHESAVPVQDREVVLQVGEVMRKDVVALRPGQRDVARLAEEELRDGGARDELRGAHRATLEPPHEEDLVALQPLP